MLIEHHKNLREENVNDFMRLERKDRIARTTHYPVLLPFSFTLLFASNSLFFTYMKLIKELSRETQHKSNQIIDWFGNPNSLFWYFWIEAMGLGA